MIKKKWVVFRRLVQFLFFNLFVYILWSTTYPLKGLFSPEIIFNFDPLIILFTALSQRVFLIGILFSSVLVVLTLFLGRFFCGWICPLGTLNDWIGILKRKKTIPKDRTNQKIRRIKFFLLSIIAVLAFLGYQVAWVLDPIVTAARFVSLNLIPTITLGINQFFIFIIKHYELYDGAVYDFYRLLKNSVLGIHPYYFDHSGIIFSFFLAIIISNLFMGRFWCRVLCPLGAFYNLFSKPALLERQVEECIGCNICAIKCRMGAIRRDMNYAKGECILCMDCIYDCPKKSTKFTFYFQKKMKNKNPTNRDQGITRKEFNALLMAIIPVLGLSRTKRSDHEKSQCVIRPPGSLEERDFVDRCIRCGNCMKVCPTNGLQPVMFETGGEGIWTPKLVPEIGYCEYYCNLCGQVCPTGAIQNLALDRKQKEKMGIAWIDKSKCIAWAQDSECLVCEEHCPIDKKAIKAVERIVKGRKILNPIVDRELCIGCGICQNVCPTGSLRAIRVDPTQKNGVKI